MNDRERGVSEGNVVFEGEPVRHEVIRCLETLEEKVHEDLVRGRMGIVKYSFAKMKRTFLKERVA